MKSRVVAALSLAALAATGYGLHQAVHSPLFTVRIVEVTEETENPPADAQTITELAGVPVGEVNLFDLELRSIELRVKKHPWVKRVDIRKRFPQTVVITPVFRQAKALAQLPGGALAYVDEEGEVFGKVSQASPPDLPLLSGFQAEAPARARQALALVDAWTRAQLDPASQISSVSYDAERGYRAFVSYPLAAAGEANARGAKRGKATVDFGHDVASDIDGRLKRLKQVVSYLSEKSIPARQIYSDIGKKIVVKVARGS